MPSRRAWSAAATWRLRTLWRELPLPEVLRKLDETHNRLLAYMDSVPRPEAVARSFRGNQRAPTVVMAWVSLRQ